MMEFRAPECNIEFVRATENAALRVMHWIGRGDKEAADAAACEAICGVFDLVDVRGEVVIGEGIKDDAPGIFPGDRPGTWNHALHNLEHKTIHLRGAHAAHKI